MLPDDRRAAGVPIGTTGAEAGAATAFTADSVAVVDRSVKGAGTADDVMDTSCGLTETAAGLAPAGREASRIVTVRSAPRRRSSALIDASARSSSDLLRSR